MLQEALLWDIMAMAAFFAPLVLGAFVNSQWPVGVPQW